MFHIISYTFDRAFKALWNVYEHIILTAKTMCVTETKEPEVETASNSTIEPDDTLQNLSDNELTVKLYRHLQEQRLVTIHEKLPTLDDARAIIAADFKDMNDLWKVMAPKKVLSRYFLVFLHPLFGLFVSAIVDATTTFEKWNFEL